MPLMIGENVYYQEISNQWEVNGAQYSLPPGLFRTEQFDPPAAQLDPIDFSDDAEEECFDEVDNDVFEEVGNVVRNDTGNERNDDPSNVADVELADEAIVDFNDRFGIGVGNMVSEFI